MAVLDVTVPLTHSTTNETRKKHPSHNKLLQVGSYCAGGPIGGAGDVATKCPAGSITAATGSVTISQCLVPPGSYYNGKDVVKCDGE